MFGDTLDFIVKNNIAYGNYSYTYQVAHCPGGVGRDITVYSVDNCNSPANYPAHLTVTNNWETSLEILILLTPILRIQPV